MSITIDTIKCVGCGRCLSVCPGSLLQLNQKNKANIKYPQNCWGCCACIKECSHNALGLYLGADIGGQGSIMSVIKQDDILYWQVTKSDGFIHKIAVKAKEANRY